MNTIPILYLLFFQLNPFSNLEFTVFICFLLYYFIDEASAVCLSVCLIFLILNFRSGLFCSNSFGSTTQRGEGKKKMIILKREEAGRGRRGRRGGGRRHKLLQWPSCGPNGEAGPPTAAAGMSRTSLNRLESSAPQSAWRIS